MEEGVEEKSFLGIVVVRRGARAKGIVERRIGKERREESM